MKLNFIITDDGGDCQAENRVNYCQKKFQPYNVGQMLGEKEVVPGNIAVVVIGDTNIEQYVQDH